MKTLIVYYSHEGNTDFVAKKIAEKTGADTLRLVPAKKYPEKAFGKLKESIGIDSLVTTLILIDPKDKPTDDNDRKIEDFCKEIF
ncbi:hypothetical protein [Pseudobutyrivibrio sp.]|uniref:hypothetical protein n=1 Tax=Pseudobutyrivibrio sp. TaxID=2014367 RepID=UPI001DB9D8DE|nr:hypothetical protein [Pseudobutyrivibrio sp.]MBE5911960.1 hypothetical protein [Pseudobutyrivibrio sp.]